MKSVNIFKVADELNARASAHPIGRLPEIRKQLKGLTRRPGGTLFQKSTTNEYWAFHFGGRAELQFNIGLDGSGGKMLRHGVAFSLETSQSLPEITPLIPKVHRFGTYLTQHPAQFSDMKMWHFERDTRSKDSPPGPIAEELIRPGVFVFLGKLQRAEDVDYETILTDFDRLLSLYEYVEREHGAQASIPSVEMPFSFRAGCSVKPSAAIAQARREPTNVDLRHNALQAKLYRILSAKYGLANVGTEIQSGAGTRIDVVLNRGGAFWFYEIKTSRSPRECIREAIGQLLEYSNWRKPKLVTRLIVVGESRIDSDAAKYLQQLRESYSIPIHYEQLTL